MNKLFIALFAIATIAQVNANTEVEIATIATQEITEVVDAPTKSVVEEVVTPVVEA